MNIKFCNYLVLGSNDNLRNMKVSRQSYQYTGEGMLLYPIKGVIPIIQRGYGCIGTAVIKSFTVNENTTTVEFEFTEVDKNAAKVLYSLYMNSSTMTAELDTSDPYNNDVVIPGAMGGAPKENLAERKRNKNSIFSDFDD